MQLQKKNIAEFDWYSLRYAPFIGKEELSSTNSILVWGKVLFELLTGLSYADNFQNLRTSHCNSAWERIPSLRQFGDIIFRCIDCQYNSISELSNEFSGLVADFCLAEIAMFDSYASVEENWKKAKELSLLNKRLPEIYIKLAKYDDLLCKGRADEYINKYEKLTGHKTKPLELGLLICKRALENPTPESVRKAHSSLSTIENRESKLVELAPYLCKVYHLKKRFKIRANASKQDIDQAELNFQQNLNTTLDNVVSADYEPSLLSEVFHIAAQTTNDPAKSNAYLIRAIAANPTLLTKPDLLQQFPDGINKVLIDNGNYFVTTTTPEVTTALLPQEFMLSEFTGTTTDIIRRICQQFRKEIVNDTLVVYHIIIKGDEVEIEKHKSFLDPIVKPPQASSSTVTLFDSGSQSQLQIPVIRLRFLSRRGPWNPTPEVLNLAWVKKASYYSFLLKKGEANFCNTEFERFKKYYTTFLKGSKVKIEDFFLVHNTKLLQNFENQFSTLNKRLQREVFSHQHWKENGDSMSKLSAAVYDFYQRTVKKIEFNNGPNLAAVIPFVHGTSEELAWEIVNNGFACISARNLNAGWFGTGAYITTYAEYAKHYASNYFIIGWAALGNVYPCTDNPSYSQAAEKSFKGQVMKGYDANYVRTTNKFFAVSSIGELGNEEGKNFDELVLHQDTALLPQYVVRLAPE